MIQYLAVPNCPFLCCHSSQQQASRAICAFNRTTFHYNLFTPDSIRGSLPARMFHKYNPYNLLKSSCLGRIQAGFWPWQGIHGFASSSAKRCQVEAEFSDSDIGQCWQAAAPAHLTDNEPGEVRLGSGKYSLPALHSDLTTRI